MSSSKKLKNENDKEFITERSQHNKFVTQSEIINDCDLNNVEEQNNKKYFSIDALELENLMGLYKERGEDYKDLIYFEKKSVHQIILDLKSDPERGITSFDEREEAFGSNKVFLEPVPPFCSYVWEGLKDLMVRILIVVAIISIILGCTFSDYPSKDWIDGVSIFVAILVVVLVGSIIDYRKEQKFHEINEIQTEGTKYKLIRKGIPEDHISDDILVGDLIMINHGDIIAADILLVEGNGILMDESALTGESDAKNKEKYEKCVESLIKEESKIPSPLILSGTKCIEGSGKGIVIAVGDHSQKGIISRTIDNAQEDSLTPLEEKLDRIAGLLGYFGFTTGIITLIALMIRFAISFSKESNEYNKSSKIESIMTEILFNFPYNKNNKNYINNTNNQLSDPKFEIAHSILDIIILCISIIVVGIPEGLPLAVTLSLAFSIKQLINYNNLVRKMYACETMAGVNYICTDKTGTLTKNEMSVFQVLTGIGQQELKQNLELDYVGSLKEEYNNEETIQIREDYQILFKNKEYWETLKTAIAVNVDASITKLEKENINGDREICESKNKTDKAFIDFLYRFKSPISDQKEKYLKNEKLFKQFPFDSEKKRMTTFVQNSDFPTEFRLFTKGAAENSTLFCKYFLDPNTGDKKDFDDKVSMQIKQSIEEFNKNKLRSLYIAYKDINKEEFESPEKLKDEKLIDQYDLIFLAVFGIKDSLRDGVIEAVKKCYKASVNLIMITGDNIVTATSIAKDCGILGNEVNLKNLGPHDIEDDPELMNNISTKEEYIKKLIENKPKALTGNSFYKIIGGLICDTCGKDTNLCECPKTEYEAKKRAEEEQTCIQPIKKEIIKDMENFKKITENLKVMARSQPLHKYSLVLGLKLLKNVVAVTGDGTNDAQALSKSDVGFAMFTGTDIAKEASDIVIIDNNFSSIVTAIIYGRNIYDNIRKFLQFKLSVYFCACILVFICACIGNETPLTSIQMLWVNLIMDSLGSLALTSEPPYEELLEREPTKRNESIINGRMWKHIIIQSLVQILLLIILYLLAPEFIKEDNLIRVAENKIIKYCYSSYPGKDTNYIIYGTEAKWELSKGKLNGYRKEYCGKYVSKQNLQIAYNQYINSNDSTTHMTLIFNIFVFYTLFNQINCRVIDDSFNILARISRSFLFLLICFSEMALQVVIIFIGKSAFHIVNEGLTGKQWGICIGLSAITFVVSFIAKLIPIHDFIENLLFKMDQKEKVEKKNGKYNDINNEKWKEDLQLSEKMILKDNREKPKKALKKNDKDH